MQNNFIGEDRTFGGSELYVDLVPSSCWFTNVRYCVEPCDWDKIRKKVYSRINYTCECCFRNCIKEKIPIEAHERWEYNYFTRTQKLVRLIGLCKPCHLVTHIGFAKISGKEQEALEHLKNIRKFNFEELKEHVDIAYTIWIEKNQIEWELDLSLITSNDFTIAKPVDKTDRKFIVENKLV
jgi:hypothetical protein